MSREHLLTYYRQDSMQQDEHLPLSNDEHERLRRDLIVIIEALKSVSSEEASKLQRQKQEILKIFVQSALRFAYKKATNYFHTHRYLDETELIQIANNALTQAAETYDPKRSHFLTHARWTILSAFTHFLRQELFHLRILHDDIPERIDLYFRESRPASHAPEQYLLDAEERMTKQRKLREIVTGIIHEFSRKYCIPRNWNVDKCIELITYIAVTLPFNEESAPKSEDLATMFALKRRQVLELIQAFKSYKLELVKDEKLRTLYQGIFTETEEV